MKVLLNEHQIQEAVSRLAREIEDYYRDRPLTVIGVMTGSVVLLADLIRQISLPVRVGAVQARSYRGAATRPGPLRIASDLMPDVRDRDVLLVDDIFDTGNTLHELVQKILDMKPRSVRTCVLLLKEGREEVSLRPDHVGFSIADLFVVGYGLDYRDAYRNLPFVAVLEDGELSGEADP